MRVLIVEDEPYLADAVRVGLRRETIAADVVHDGAAALEAVAGSSYDVVVLDRDLPGIHGDEVCARLARDHPEVRVLMLTAARSLGDRVAGFELGADDYLLKPFEFPELVARLRALERRTQPARPPVVEAHGVRLDAFRREVYRDGRLVRLSPKEFAVLQVLMNADGGVVSAEALLERAWDANTDPFTNTIRVTISNLRRRLGEPWVIRTVPGAGYRFGA
ncbi:two-component system, OmpR family, response regulator VanR [Promicromonospora umidemergens]|uniref:Response regulator transcription factor n=1 Tax=Promicromonospora umidemergens TaxID=629679 RepID=A0ABP8Y7M1_9MICO|nr:response regulator transcription factor [Promicromonospora umidemergens]MCP2282403.1 two-component system, OmpR family, response regulator VanR [Promicromonospora umidemergens]